MLDPRTLLVYTGQPIRSFSTSPVHQMSIGRFVSIYVSENPWDLKLAKPIAFTAGSLRLHFCFKDLERAARTQGPQLPKIGTPIRKW